MANDLTIFGSGAPTMSSLEIAELCGKVHKHILTDIDRVLAELGIQSAEFSADYKDAMGRTQRCYNLDQDLTMTLVSGYNVQMRYRIVKRWRELEAAPLKSKVEMLRDAAVALFEQEQKLLVHDDRLAELEARQDSVEGRRDYQTVLGYAKYHKVSLPARVAGSLGKKAKRLHKVREVPYWHKDEGGLDKGMGAEDERYGNVGLWHKDILKEVFQAYMQED